MAKGRDLRGKRGIITGGASGIGIDTARALAKIGAEVTLAVRNLESAAAMAADVVRATGNLKIRVARLDLGDCRSIQEFLARSKSVSGKSVRNIHCEEEYSASFPLRNWS